MKLPVTGEALAQPGDGVEAKRQENSPGALSSADEVKRLPVAGEALWQPGDGVVVKRPRGENSSGSISSAGTPDAGSLRTEVPPTPSRRAGLSKGAAPRPAGAQ
jgi:hypothetical protein